MIGFMEMHADPSHVLMSDVLKGQVSELDDVTVEQLKSEHVIVIGDMCIGPKRTAIMGILRGVLFDVDPEIEFRINLEEALGIIQASELSFAKFQLHHGVRIVEMPGPFLVKAARLDEIDATTQLCTLGLHLKKPLR